MSADDDLLPLSGIQHFVFCRRQWSLIHIEQQWKEDWRTMDGQIIHTRAHDCGQREKRGSLIISRGLPIVSHSLGLSGTCDVVEFHSSLDGIPLPGEAGLWQPVPVEYKRGRPKAHGADELQLTAQALCLEQMLACEITHGFLYYNEPSRRTRVEIDTPRRDWVAKAAGEMHDLYQRGHTPKVKQHPGCKSCSLKELCLPRLTKITTVSAYLQAAVADKEAL